MKVDGLSGESMTDIFEIVKRYNISIKVEYIFELDSYRIIIYDKLGEMHNILDGSLLDTNPEFSEKALERCIWQYIKRRR